MILNKYINKNHSVNIRGVFIPTQCVVDNEQLHRAGFGVVVMWPKKKEKKK